MRCTSCATFVNRDAPSCWLCHAPLRPDAATSVPAVSRRRFGQPLRLQVASVAPPASRNARFKQAALTPKQRAWPRPRLPTLRTLAFALGAFVLVAALLFGALVAYGAVTDPGSDDAVHSYAKNEHGATYTSRAGRFRAVFPTQPTLTTAAGTTPDGRPATAHVIESKPGTDYTFSVRYQDQAVTPGDAKAALDVRTSQLASSSRTLLAPADSGFGRATVRDIYSHRAGTYYRDRLIFVDDHIYTIEVGSHHKLPEGWDRFVQSFTLALAS
jgi:hypothetical protein